MRTGAGGHPPWLADYEALRNAFGARRGRCSLIDACGPDAEGFLQGQLSADVSALEVGGSARTLLLHPDGKLHSVLRVHRVGEQRYWLVASAEGGRRALERLERFKLRTDCEMRLAEVETLTVLGPQAPPAPLREDGEAPAAEDGGEPTPPREEAPAEVGEAPAPQAEDGGAPTAVCVEVRWGSVSGWELIGEVGEVGERGHALRECAGEAFEALRVELGVPADSEFQEGMIPAESGVVAETVSFTKGCFVGQELVARIDSRGGNVPRNLRGVLITGGGAADPGGDPDPLVGSTDPDSGGDPTADAAETGTETETESQPPPAGAALVLADGSKVGELTTVSYSPALGRTAALAYVRRKVVPPARVEVRWDGGSAQAEIRTLPLAP